MNDIIALKLAAAEQKESGEKIGEYIHPFRASRGREGRRGGGGRGSPQQRQAARYGGTAPVRPTRGRKMSFRSPKQPCYVYNFVSSGQYERNEPLACTLPPPHLSE